MEKTGIFSIFVIVSNDSIRMNPPFEITSAILSLVAAISEKLGEINAAHLVKPSTELRKKNRIRTIHASLGIEGNTLSVEQITAILEKKRVIGPAKEVLEVKNAIDVYHRIGDWRAAKSAHFLVAHGLLMAGLLDGAGKFRAETVGILKGDQLAHLPPPGNRVAILMAELFEWLKKSTDHPLIKSCVFHYEMEFIHPFMDGNGRMGRLWQTVILMEKYPVFEFLPVETTIKTRQSAYYNVLSVCDKAGNSTAFTEFMLDILNESLGELLASANVSLDGSRRMELFQTGHSGGAFSRKDYLRCFKNIAVATASRDLKRAVEAGILSSIGEKSRMVYAFN